MFLVSQKTNVYLGVYFLLLVTLLLATYLGWFAVEPYVKGCMIPALLFVAYSLVLQGGKESNFFSRKTSKWVFGFGMTAALVGDVLMVFEAADWIFRIAIYCYITLYAAWAWLFFTIANKTVHINWFFITVTVLVASIIGCVYYANWEGIIAFKWSLLLYGVVFSIFIISCINASASAYVWPERSLFILGGAFFTIISQALIAFSKFSPIRNLVTDLLILFLYYVAQLLIVKGLLERRAVQPIL